MNRYRVVSDLERIIVGMEDEVADALRRAERAERRLAEVLEARRADVAEVALLRHALAGVVRPEADPESVLVRALGPNPKVK